MGNRHEGIYAAPGLTAANKKLLCGFAVQDDLSATTFGFSPIIASPLRPAQLNSLGVWKFNYWWLVRQRAVHLRLPRLAGPL